MTNHAVRHFRVDALELEVVISDVVVEGAGDVSIEIFEGGQARLQLWRSRLRRGSSGGSVSGAAALRVSAQLQVGPRGRQDIELVFWELRAAVATVFLSQLSGDPIDLRTLDFNSALRILRKFHGSTAAIMQGSGESAIEYRSLTKRETRALGFNLTRAICGSSAYGNEPTASSDFHMGYLQFGLGTAEVSEAVTKFEKLATGGRRMPLAEVEPSQGFNAVDEDVMSDDGATDEGDVRILRAWNDPDHGYTAEISVPRSAHDELVNEMAIRYLEYSLLSILLALPDTAKRSLVDNPTRLLTPDEVERLTFPTDHLDEEDESGDVRLSQHFAEALKHVTIIEHPPER